MLLGFSESVYEEDCFSLEKSWIFSGNGNRDRDEQTAYRAFADMILKLKFLFIFSPFPNFLSYRRDLLPVIIHRHTIRACINDVPKIKIGKSKIKNLILI